MSKHYEDWLEKNVPQRLPRDLSSSRGMGFIRTVGVVLLLGVITVATGAAAAVTTIVVIGVIGGVW